MATKSGLRKIFNRHGLPDEIKDIVMTRKAVAPKEEQANQVQKIIKSIIKNADDAGLPRLEKGP